MSPPKDVAALRSHYDRTSADLLDRLIVGVSCWDIHNYSDEPRTWDYDDWHHAVMGVDLATDRGPISIVPTNTFFPYGVESSRRPCPSNLHSDLKGLRAGKSATTSAGARAVTAPCCGRRTFWERIEMGPGYRLSDYEQVSEAQTYDVPVALRLDFSVGPVCFVAAQPNWPNVEEVFIPGDEIMIVYSGDRMLKVGFPDGDFIAPNPQP